MRFWLVFLIAFVVLTIVAAFNAVHEEDLEVAESRVKRGFGSRLKKIGKGTSKHLKSAVKAVGRYAKKHLKDVFNEAKDWLKEQLKNAFTSEGPICYNRACAFCLKFELIDFKTKLCAGAEYDRSGGSFKFALKHQPFNDDDMVFLYKKQITGVMKIPNCATLPYVKQICLQGIRVKVPDIKLASLNDTHINAEACVVIVARKYGVGGKLCMTFENGEKKASFNLLTGEERNGTLYISDADVDDNGQVTFGKTTDLKTGETVNDDDLPE